MMIQGNRLSFLFGFLCSVLLLSGVAAIDDKNSEKTIRRRTSLRSFISDRLNSTTNSSSSIAATPCIGDDAGLRVAVSKATSISDGTKPATIITLCDRVKISASIKDPKFFNVTGINLSKKKIELKCAKGDTGSRCIIDGQRSSRIFYGTNTFLRATNFDFINAYVAEGDKYSEGTAATFTKNSTVSFNQCSFRNNNGRGLGGGTVFMEDSTLTLRGTKESPMMFTNNYDFSASSLYLDNTRFNAVTGNIYFVNNTAGHTGAVRMIGSKVSMKGIVFQNNTAEDNGVMWAEDCASTLFLENIQFLNNRAYDQDSSASAIKLVSCDSKIKGVTFAYNAARYTGALTVDLSEVTLTNVTFRNNTIGPSGGGDLYIVDNENPVRGGSFVSCDTNSVKFCNGVGKRNIKDTTPVKNTNCVEKGIRKC